MKNEQFQKSAGNLIGIISLSIAVIILALILNWFFRITPFQKLQGMPLLIAPFTSILGFILGIVSFKKAANIFSKLGMVSNSILFVLPFLYWGIGTLVFGV